MSTVKDHYNEQQIELAVKKLEGTRSAIKNDLNLERYGDIVETIDQTILSLNNSDDLMPFQRQVKEQIIEPVNTRIRRSSTVSITVSLLFGLVGIVGFALTYMQSPINFISFFNPMFSSTTNEEHKGNYTENEESAVELVKKTAAIIYPDNIDLSMQILNQYIECKHLVSNYLALSQQEEAEKQQDLLDDELNPLLTAKFNTFHAELALAGFAARKPPKQREIHPYKLAETATIIKQYFPLEKLQNVWKDCI